MKRLVVLWLTLWITVFGASFVLGSGFGGGGGCTANCTFTGTTTVSGLNATGNAAVTGTATLSTVNATAQYQLNGINKNPMTSLTNTAAFAAIASTNAETYFAIGGTGLITAGTLNAAGTRLEVDLAGIYGTNGVTDTINLKFKLCTVSGCGSGTVVQIATTGVVTPGVGVTNLGWNARVGCTVFTTGASGTMDCQGLPGAVYFTALTSSILDDIFNTGTSTIDFTVAEYLSVSATWNNNSINNTITLRNLVVRIY